jgi:predicted Zn-dependent protease
MRPLRSAICLVPAAALLLGGCAGGQVRTYQQAGDTRQLSDAESRTWHAAGEIDRHLRRKGLIYDDPRLTGYLQSIADRLYPEFKGTVHVQLIDSPQLNAFALPNGSIYLNMGLVARMQNEAQLATVIGHEISHFTHQHALKIRHAADSAVIAGMVVSIATGVSASGQLLVAGAMSGYSQDMEREADRLGFQRLVQQGYDPHEATAVFRLMREEVEALEIDEPFLYSSHPKLSERIATMTEFAAGYPADGGRKHTEQFRRLTQGLRSVLLERYLDARNYKILILILENRSLRLLYPDHADYYLAEAYRQRGEEGDAVLAEHAYRQTLTLAPEFADSHRGLGLLLMKRGDKAQAARHLARYLQMKPDAEDAGYIRAYIAKLKE